MTCHVQPASSIYTENKRANRTKPELGPCTPLVSAPAPGRVSWWWLCAWRPCSCGRRRPSAGPAAGPPPQPVSAACSPCAWTVVPASPSWVCCGPHSSPGGNQQRGCQSIEVSKELSPRWVAVSDRCLCNERSPQRLSEETAEPLQPLLPANPNHCPTFNCEGSTTWVDHFFTNICPCNMEGKFYCIVDIVSLTLSFFTSFLFLLFSNCVDEKEKKVLPNF